MGTGARLPRGVWTQAHIDRAVVIKNLPSVEKRWFRNGLLAHGNEEFTNAHSVDVSKSGMRIEMLEPIVERSYVRFRANELALHGAASVRSCCRKGAKHIVGREQRWHEMDAAAQARGLPIRRAQMSSFFKERHKRSMKTLSRTRPRPVTSDFPGRNHFDSRCHECASCGCACAPLCCLGAFLLAWFQVEGVALDLLDDVFLLDRALEAAKRALHGFTILDVYFGQRNSPRVRIWGSNVQG